MPKSIKLKDNTYWDRNSIKNDFIKVRATTNQLRSTVGSISVDFDEVVLKEGNYLQLYNKKVQVISDKVHHVKVNTTLWVERYGTSYAWCYLTKNGTNQLSYMLDRTTNNPWGSVTLSTIMEVSKNDFIYPTVYFNEANNSNGVRGGTYANSVTMTVEVID